MEGVERTTSDMSEDTAAKTESPKGPKIALVPFVEEGPPVHLLDAAGKTFPARDRCAEDDFQLAVQSVGLGHADAVGARDDDVGSVKGADGSVKGAGGSGKRADENGGELSRDEAAAPAGKKADLENGAIATKDGGDGGPAATASASGTTSGKPALSPAEHPLQKAITSLDMALGELNQLVHLIDLARAGEFMALARVTPSEEDQARAMPDQSARPGDGVPRGALATMTALKRTQLKGAADQLRQRAKRLRATSKVQRVFQQDLIHLRKSWRIVAPNHGKVDVPLQVGEPLSVDCSFGSAGGHSVVSTAAAGTRHRHPWLFQLSCGEGGRLEAEREKAQSLKAFEVQLVSATTGACEHSLRASFPAKRIRCDGGAGAEAGAGEEEEQPPPASNGGSAAEDGERGDGHMHHLQQHISRLQHSVFWEEVFETIKAEALVDGKDGWLAHPDARTGSNATGNRKAPGGIARIEAGSKRRLVSFTSRGTANVARNAGVRVVHVMDDEVMVELDNNHLLGYRLVSTEAGPHESKEGPATSIACTEGGVSADQGRSEGPGGGKLVSLCQLALLYCGSLIRQKQQTQADAESPPGSDAQSGREVGARVAASAAESAARDGTREGHSSATSTWKSVGRVLLHHIFRTEVVRGLANVSRSLLQIGLPLAVRWTHAEATFPASSLSFTLGHRFHFRASLDAACGVVVSALPGLHNHVDQRSVELHSAQDLEQFLLGEVCRQVVLTFGDITASWTSGVQKETACFRVDLVPAAIHLLPAPNTNNLCKSSVSPAESSGGQWVVRVCVQEVGVQIACSKWSSAGCTSNVKDVANESLGGKSKAKATSQAWASEFSSTTATAPDVSVAEWDRLEGRDLFKKFSSLLACLYPLQDTLK